MPKRHNLNLRLVWSLAHEPVWFGGILAVIVGFLLQAAALGGGDLSVVEPILVFELPATLILACRVFGTRMRAREWAAAAGMTAGLAALIYLLSAPERTRTVLAAGHARADRAACISCVATGRNAEGQVLNRRVYAVARQGATRSWANEGRAGYGTGQRSGQASGSTGPPW